jgi:hypothetical protein
LSENFLKVWLKRDSRDGPIRSITRTLNSPKTKNKFTFCRTVVNVGNSLVDNCGIIVEVVVKLAFIYQLGVFGIDGFYLHCNFKIGLGVDCLINFSEGPFINLPDDFEVLADFL